MSKTTKAIQPKKKNLFGKFLDMVEVVGNRMPHPATIFVLLSIAIVIISHIVAKAGVSIPYTMIDRYTHEVKDTTINAVSLWTPDGIRFMFSKAVTNFTGFEPLGTVLVAMLGVGVAEGTGLISALLKRVVLSAPKSLITIIVILAGIMSNIASDAGYVVLVPLGAIVFLSFGRHPLAGIAAAFAGVSGGFSANLLIGTLDPLLSGISTEAARFIDPEYMVNPTGNWYFMIVSTFLITAIGTYVTERIVEPRLGEYKGDAEVDLHDLSKQENKGLVAAFISLLVFIGIIVALVAPENGILREPETGAILGHTPFMEGLVPIIMFFFLVPGVTYGIFAKTIKNDKDIAKAMGKAMAGMGGYLVLTFAAAQFVAYFKYTHLGTILAVKGAEFLKTTGLIGFPLIIGFIIVSAFLNMFMGSASAKWAIMAPVFVPMFMKLGYSPEFTQVAYRIGDSTTNIISPLMSYFAVIVAFAQKYDKDTGVGTLISTMVPFFALFLIGWSLLLAVWYFVGAPLGPDAFIHLKM
ncbi:AbgT family transporter [Lutibacter sp. B2]|nr:AbgT family transporter [Lutibacter sp. B2]